MKVAFCLVVILAAGCHSQVDKAVKSGAKSPETILLDTLELPSNLHSSRSVRKFYASRNLALFWSEYGRRRSMADSLLETLVHAQSYGLAPEEYHLRELRHIINDSIDREGLRRMDAMLTDAYIAFHSHLRVGRLDPSTMQRRDLTNTIDAESIASLQHLATGSFKTHIELIEPALPQYQELKSALGNVVSGGDADSVKAGKILSLSLNLERWRWERQWPDRYVVVNVPSFLMRAVEGDSVCLESRVIVGKRDTPTPVTESVIRSFIIYPYWHVPRSIATREILPALQADAGYLRRNNFDVLNRQGRVIPADTIQWDLYSSDHFPFVLRQREGSENSMGIIKFNFANRYGVYLHDTNSKRLYGLGRRDLSHGCVRVKDAVAFAHYLIREDDVYVSPDDLDQYLMLQQRLRIELRKPIPLKLSYFTAEVRDGATFFYEDIYRKDSVMIRALFPAEEDLNPDISGGL